ncbi:MAG: hypothetical protein K6C14_05195 [Eubacterium sp.]|nr:hypothetical protein [Eubacterium sp.]
MESFINYLNTVLPDRDGDGLRYKFKRKTLDEMTQRAAEITSRGLGDRKVVDDLIISEYSDLEKQFKDYCVKENKAQNAKRGVILNAVGSVIYLFAVVVVFLGVSFVTKGWHMTWGIVVDGILLWVIYLLALGVKKFSSMQRIFHIIARGFLAADIIVSTVAVYIFVLAVTDDIPNRWLIVIAGLIMMFVCDGAYASLAHHRLAILNWLIYIPVISVFLFILIGASGVLAWSVAWIIIPLSLAVDFAVIVGAISKNKLEKLEVADTWNEN